MWIFGVIALLTIVLYVKKGDDLATIVRKVALGLLLFLVPVIIYFLISTLVTYFKDV